MEYGLGPSWQARMEERPVSLNPCFNGIWSRTNESGHYRAGTPVLILVLMEYGLGRYSESQHKAWNYES